MVKIRLLVLLSTIVIVTIFGAIAIIYANGFRFERKEDSVTLSSKGLLVVNSEPTGAQVFVDDKLETATNNTVSLNPGTHTVSVKKEGFLVWNKKIDVEKEAVTQINAYLLPSAPSLTALSFNGAVDPTISPDFTRVVYAVPKDADNPDKEGLWLYETTNLPLGFGRDPKRITDADFTVGFTFEWSPDSRQILVSSKTTAYLLDVTTFTTAKSLTNTLAQVTKTRKDWDTLKTEKEHALLAKLPGELQSVFTSKATSINFSPDETKILYTASGSATIPSGLIKELPGSSTQAEARTTIDKEIYVYDLKEDRNFLVGASGNLVYWVPNSLNLIIPEKNKISVSDYDGTNKQTIFEGNYIYPFAFPTTSTSKMVILTSFGATGSFSNLYWLSLK